MGEQNRGENLCFYYVSNNFFWTQRNCGGGRKKFGGALPPNAPRGYEPVPTTKSAKFTRRINVERAAERQESHSRPQANETLSRFEESSATNAGDAVHVEDQPVARKRVSGFAGSYAGAAARARRDDSAEKELCSCRTKKKKRSKPVFFWFLTFDQKKRHIHLRLLGYICSGPLVPCETFVIF